MKHLNIFKRALLALLILCSSSVWAYDFDVDGIYYNITDETSRTVAVTSGENKYTGSVVIPSAVTYNSVAYSVTSIGDEAFYRCTGLTSVTIPNSVTSIGYGAFRNCDGLTSITIPNSVTSIGDKAFYLCWLLTSIEIPNSVTSIGDSAFFNCSSLISIEIPNSVTSIGYYAFEYCTGLTSVTIGNGLTTISGSTFIDCSQLTNINIGKNVTSIESSAFERCSSLTAITIPNNVTYIGNYAFYECTKLKTVYNESMLNIIAGYDTHGYVAYYADNVIVPIDYIFEVINGKNTLTKYVGNDNDITLPASYNGEIYIIGEKAFNECTNITNIVIPNSVISIGNYAFNGCTGLTSITIPGSVTSIGNYAFKGCTGLTSITIPGGVTSIGDRAFAGCSSLTSVTIPNSVTTIGQNVFSSCSSLTNVTIPNSVTSIGYGAFYECNNLENVTMSNNITAIEEGTFYNCSKLASIAIPNSVATIGKNAFRGCSNLTEITIPSRVTNIGDLAFYDCSRLFNYYFASNPQIGSYVIHSAATCHLTLTDSDAADFNTANANTYADVSYTRTISEGKYGTIMLPFVPDEASLENYAFYTLKEAGDGYIKFEEVAAPVANTPYLYTLRAGGENTAITGGQTTIAADINNCNVNGWEFIGSFNNNTIDCTDGNYYAYSAARNEINRITKTLTVSPYRAYLKSTAAQNSNLRVFIGGTTSVTEISPDDIEGFDGGAVYDLYGRPVNEPAKGGVYIINGKKVVW
ncbi:MAG: leucine-rich repeat protein [Bacteroidaceae bacterium]|nr:leucine-rich repeat protein [Bacteroidaceae bacterium]